MSTEHTIRVHTQRVYVGAAHAFLIGKYVSTMDSGRFFGQGEGYEHFHACYTSFISVVDDWGNLVVVTHHLPQSH